MKRQGALIGHEAGRDGREAATIAIVHSTILGDKLDETLAALLVGKYRLGDREPSEPAGNERITTTLEPKTLIRSGLGMQLSVIALTDHLAETDETTAIAHAVECLSSRRLGMQALRRIEDALRTVAHACIGMVPDPNHSVLDIATACPWRGYSTAWWRDDVGPRDGTTSFEPSVPFEDLVPRSVLLDHFVQADGYGRLGMCVLRSTLHASGIDTDPVETLRRLVDLKDRPIAEMTPDLRDGMPTSLDVVRTLDTGSHT